MGLKDRVEALGGTLEVVSPPGRRDSTRRRDPARHGGFDRLRIGIPVAGLGARLTLRASSALCHPHRRSASGRLFQFGQ